MEASGEHGNKTQGSVKERQFPDQPSEYKLLKNSLLHGIILWWSPFLPGFIHFRLLALSTKVSLLHVHVIQSV
jgi:hypothetical protein